MKLAQLDTRVPDVAVDFRAFPARAGGAVADDPHRVNVESVAVEALPERADLDTMEHRRQNRLKRWQTPPIETRNEAKR